MSDDVKSIIIRNATKLFKHSGFHNTSLANIAIYSKISKSKLHYYFKTKVALALDVINYIDSKFTDLMESELKTLSKYPSHHFQIVLFILAEYSVQSPYSVVIPKLFYEVAEENKEIKAAIKAHYQKWLNIICYHLPSHTSEKKAYMSAQMALLILQGAIQHYTLNHSDEEIYASCEMLSQHFANINA